MGPGTPPAFPGGEHGYESLDPTEIFEVNEVTDPVAAMAMIDELLFLNTFAGASAFDDPLDPGVTVGSMLYPVLADGPLVLGSYVASPADDGGFVTIPITPGGLGYLDLFSGGPLVLSGTLPTAVGPPDPEVQLIFGFTGPDIPGGDPLTPVLEVTFVPEANGVLFLISSFTLFIGRRVRKVPITLLSLGE